MKFTIPQQVPIDRPVPVEVGNVYVSKNTVKTAAWVVVGVSAHGCCLLGINSEGEVTTTQSYNLHTMERRNLIGRCDIASLSFDIVPV
jgi:hypothetical protein